MRYITSKGELYSLAQGVQRRAKQYTTKYPKYIQKRQLTNA